MAACHHSIRCNQSMQRARYSSLSILHLTRPRWLILVVLLVGWLSGCTTASSSNLTLEYHRTGGFAGLDDRLAIDVSGAATLTRKARTRAFTLDSSQLAHLDQLFADADFSNMQAKYLPANESNDLFEYTITYKRRTVRAMDTAVPDQLLPVIDELNRLVERGP
jgi:hypothetical protein